MSPRRESTRTFDCFGGTAAVIVGGSSTAGTSSEFAAILAQGRLRSIHHRLSRFEPFSELALLNADPQLEVYASRLVRALAHGVVAAGELSGGLVDATLVDEIERAGYRGSRAGQPGLLPAELAFDDTPRRAARPHPDAGWTQIRIDDGERTIIRPPGVRIDSGGLGKGLAADLVADALAAHPAFAVDCSGDVRIGGTAGVPRRVLIADPAGAAPLHELEIVAGAVATSGISRRSWRAADGSAAHHLLDPATGMPAWTGVIQATALAPTALEAEILAKAALLAGPRHGRDLLVHGGLLVRDDGSVDLVSDRELSAQPA